MVIVLKGIWRYNYLLGTSFGGIYVRIEWSNILLKQKQSILKLSLPKAIDISKRLGKKGSPYLEYDF